MFDIQDFVVFMPITNQEGRKICTKIMKKLVLIRKVMGRESNPWGRINFYQISLLFIITIPKIKRIRIIGGCVED